MTVSRNEAIQALLIDLDGVIRIWEPGRTATVERVAGLPAGAIARIAFDPPLLHLAVRGEITDEVWRERVRAGLSAAYPAADAAGAVAAWSAPAGTVDQEALAIVRACRQQVPVVLVTNATTRLPRDLGTLGLDREFDHIINSSAVGACKPAPKIFAAALHAAGVSAYGALFVDDTVDNVAAAAALGLRAAHYQSPVALRAELARHGIVR